MSTTETNLKPAAKPEAKLPETVTPARASAPKLLFQDTAGVLNDHVVNTFRVGKKWADRAKVGDILTAAAAEGEEPFGEVEITDVLTGSWDEMKVTASDNHSWYGKPSAEAQAGLLDTLGAIYPTFDPSKDTLTVLYFKKA